MTTTPSPSAWFTAASREFDRRTHYRFHGNGDKTRYTTELVPTSPGGKTHVGWVYPKDMALMMRADSITELLAAYPHVDFRRLTSGDSRVPETFRAKGYPDELCHMLKISFIGRSSRRLSDDDIERVVADVFAHSDRWLDHARLAMPGRDPSAYLEKLNAAASAVYAWRWATTDEEFPTKTKIGLTKNGHDRWGRELGPTRPTDFPPDEWEAILETREFTHIAFVPVPEELLSEAEASLHRAFASRRVTDSSGSRSEFFVVEDGELLEVMGHLTWRYGGAVVRFES